MHKLYLVMVGLPARGKSRLARRICGGLAADGFRSAIVNNGDVRRELLHGDVAGVAFRLRMAHHHDIAAQILVGVLIGQCTHAAQRENDGQGKSKELLHLDYLLLMFDAAPERRMLVYIY